MLNLSTPDLSVYDQKVRIRVCGLLRTNDSLLLIKHKYLGPKGFLWLPPGGGVEFGASLSETLIREFKEETNLEINVLDYLFTNEFISNKHHAVELFFKVEKKGGELSLGIDPELADDSQIIEKVAFLPFNAINLMDKHTLHNIFREVDSSNDIFSLRGLFTFRL